MAADRIHAAIYTRLNGDATLKGLATGGIHHRLAPQGTEAPYVIFQRQAGTSLRTFAPGSTERAVWLVKSVCRGASATKAEEIDARCQALLDGVKLSPATGRALTVERHSAVEYGEASDGEQIHHVGSLYRIHT